MSLTAKKVYYIFENHLKYNCWLAFFSCVENSRRKESQAEENRYLIWTAYWSGENNTLRHTGYNYHFLISNCSNESYFLNWRQFCFISDCGNSFSCKLKKLINKQIVRFYSPSHALCSSDESVQVKQFKHHTFIGMYSHFTDVFMVYH